jgi:divalent metal cation (Fe/Co/Zn/Cd) transporter
MPIDGHQTFFDADHSTADGILMLILGVMFLVTTFKGGTLPMTPAWLWISTAAGFAIAAFLIIQGSILALASRWPF